MKLARFKSLFLKGLPYIGAGCQKFQCSVQSGLPKAYEICRGCLRAAIAHTKFPCFMTSRAFSDHSPLSTHLGDGRQRSTAYKGASHAFSLAAPVISLPKTDIGTNGALAAATTAGMGMRRQGVRIAEGTTSKGQNQEISSTKTPHRSGVSIVVINSREQSPYAAALHAASKSTPASTQKSVKSAPNSRQPSSLQHFKVNKFNAPPIMCNSKDDAVVGATGSLVSLYESKQNPPKNVPNTHSVRYVTKPTSAMASPEPIKPPTGPTLSITRSVGTLPLAAGLEGGFTASDPSKTMGTGIAPTATRSVGRTSAGTIGMTESADSTLISRTVPEPTARRRSGARSPLDVSLGKGRNLPRISVGSAPLVFAKSAEPSTTLQISESDPAILLSKRSSAPPSRPLLPVISLRGFETKIDSLANTIVAASLASSRAPSPTKTPPPPPRRHKSHSLFHNYHGQGRMSRTPSPAKAMRYTMREPLPSYNGIEHKKKSILMRRHPHKHHEGDRERYRAIVTESERRRYDGVWAANKGLWMKTDSSESVLNLVVRDIWSRSRLPNDILANIWDLVDIHGGDRLDRSEFVVGMWLIDQRLKGRKLPFMVSESLWNSVRLLHGVKISRHQY